VALTGCLVDLDGKLVNPRRNVFSNHPKGSEDHRSATLREGGRAKVRSIAHPARRCRFASGASPLRFVSNPPAAAAPSDEC
jgi:hypothetical protein